MTAIPSTSTVLAVEECDFSPPLSAGARPRPSTTPDSASATTLSGAPDTLDDLPGRDGHASSQVSRTQSLLSYFDHDDSAGWDLY